MVLAPGFLSEIRCLNHLQPKQPRQDHEESETQQNAGGHHSPSLLSRLEHGYLTRPPISPSHPGSAKTDPSPLAAETAALSPGPLHCVAKCATGSTPWLGGAPVWDAGRPTPPDHSVG